MASREFDVERAVDALAGSDRTQLARLFEHHRQPLAKLVSLYLAPVLRGRVACADVLQEAYLDADRRVNDYLERRDVDFYVWLRGITMQRLAKLHRFHLRTQRRAVAREIPLPEQSSIMLAERLVSGGSSPSSHLRKEELRARLKRAISDLPESDREVILMRHFENLTNQQVAQALGLQESAATMRYGRAIYRLRTALLQVGESSF